MAVGGREDDNFAKFERTTSGYSELSDYMVFSKSCSVFSNLQKPVTTKPYTSSMNPSTDEELMKPR